MGINSGRRRFIGKLAQHPIGAIDKISQRLESYLDLDLPEFGVSSSGCRKRTQPVWKREFLGRQARHGDAMPGSGPDRLHQTTNAQNADYPFHIVGQDV